MEPRCAVPQGSQVTPRGRRSIVASGLAVSLLAAPVIAAADPKREARPHIERGSRLHAAGKYNEALKELTLAYALDPQPQLLYAIGQVHVKLGDCEGATTFYRRFLATKPEPRQAAVARQAITRCESAATTPEPEPVPEPRKPEPPKPEPRADAEPAARAVPSVAVEPAPPASTDWVGWTLVAGGGAVGIAGGIVYGLGLQAQSDRDGQRSLGEFSSLDDAAVSRRNIALGLFGGAVVLAGAGLIHLILHDGAPDENENVAIVPVHGGAFATWGGRF